MENLALLVVAVALVVLAASVTTSSPASVMSLMASATALRYSVRARKLGNTGALTPPSGNTLPSRN